MSHADTALETARQDLLLQAEQYERHIENTQRELNEAHQALDGARQQITELEEAQHTLNEQRSDSE